MSETAKRIGVSGRQQMSLDEWIAEGTRRFGEDKSQWKFKCAHCGHIQRAQDFKEIEMDPSGYVYFSCIGRWKQDVGCDWTLGGLFQIHTLEVLQDGKVTPVFEFAD
jgi:hypothetical protein